MILEFLAHENSLIEFRLTCAEGGILLSNSVLRAVHGELDWCVRNSYSPHHHENIGRCVLHAAHCACASAAQAQEYAALRVPDDGDGGDGGVAGALVDALADAVVAHPVRRPDHFYQLHAFVSRVRTLGTQNKINKDIYYLDNKNPLTLVKNKPQQLVLVFNN